VVRSRAAWSVAFTAMEASSYRLTECAVDDRPRQIGVGTFARQTAQITHKCLEFVIKPAFIGTMTGRTSDGERVTGGRSPKANRLHKSRQYLGLLCFLTKLPTSTLRPTVTIKHHVHVF
jgi:phosphotransacetylase